jgi:hypothetical protein
MSYLPVFAAVVLVIVFAMAKNHRTGILIATVAMVLIVGWSTVLAAVIGMLSAL